MSLPPEGEFPGSDDFDEGDVFSPSNVVPGDFRQNIDCFAGNRTEVVDVTIGLLAKQPVYQRGSFLVHVRRNAGEVRKDQIDPDGNPEIAILAEPTLSEHIGRSAHYLTKKPGPKGKPIVVEIAPPPWLVSAVNSRAQWSHVRPLLGITEWPILRTDGTIALATGYDVESQFFVNHDLKLTVPERPSLEDARFALDDLLDVVSDFPFASQIGESVWLAMLLTPMCRPAIDGPIPFFYIDANASRAGKTMLADSINYLLCGHPLSRQAIPDNDEEWAKALLSIGLAGFPIVLLDNAKTGSRIGSPQLDAALTSTKYSSRLLGQSQIVTVQMNAMFIATVNNGSLTGDLVNRSLHIRLESPVENPAERVGFKHSPLHPWITANRNRLVSSMVTFLRAYQLAGCPQPDMKPFGGYENWSRIVRAPLIWAGLADPYESQAPLRETSDVDRDSEQEFLLAWHGVFGNEQKSAKQAIKEIQHGDPHDHVPPETERFRDAVLAVTYAKDARIPNVVQLGYALRRMKDKRAAGLVFRFAPSHDKAKTRMWHVEGEPA